MAGASFDGASMEALLRQLQSPDNSIRNQAENAFNATKQQPAACMRALVALATGSADEVVRATAAVLLRRSMKDLWDGSDDQTRNGVKASLIGAMRTETKAHIRKKVCDTISVLAANTLPEGTWPDLYHLLFQLCSSAVVWERESALYVLSQLIDYLPESIEPHLATLYPLAQEELMVRDLTVSVAALRVVCAVLNTLETSKCRQYGDLIPLLFRPVSAALNAGDEETARNCIELLIETVDVEPKFWKPHLELAFDAMIQVAGTSSLFENTRQLGLEFLVSAAEKLPSVCRRAPKFGESLFPLGLSMMLELQDDEDWYTRDDDEDDRDEYTNFDAGQEALDRLAIALGGNAILSIAFQIIPSFLANEGSWVNRHAGLLAISQIGEGCRRQIEEQLGAVLGMALQKFGDPHPRVRWAAINCVGQMCTDFAPKIQHEFHGQILPALIQVMDDTQNPRVQSHAAAAIINFCDDTTPEIIGLYLDQLLAKLLGLIQSQRRITQEQAVTAVAAVADAASEKFIPFYDSFIPLLKSLLAVAAGRREMRRLRGKVMECISLIGLSVGKEKFQSDAESVMDVLVRTQGQRLDSDDPQSFYLMQAYARICRCLKEDFIRYLPFVMPGLLEAAAQKPDVEVQDALGDDEEDGDDDGMETITVGDKRIGIRTSALEDKATACSMIACFVAELKGGFIQFVEPVAKLMVPLLKFFYHDDVRTSAAQCIPDLVRAVKSQGSQADGQVHQIISFVLPALLEAVAGEPDVDVLVIMVESLSDVLELTDVAALDTAQIMKVIDTAIGLLYERQERIRERQREAQEDGWDEEQMEEVEAEGEKDDELLDRLVDSVGALLRSQGPDRFMPAFEAIHGEKQTSMVQVMASMLQPERPAVERHAALCTFDEIIEHGGHQGVNYTEQVLPAMLAYFSDPDADVRQAAAYGIGVCAEKSGDAFKRAGGLSILPRMESLIKASAQMRQDEQMEGALDNAVSALGKILEFQTQSVPNPIEMTQLWLSYLPIRGDVAEGVWNHGTLIRMLESRPDQILGGPSLANLPLVLNVLALTVGTDLMSAEYEEYASRAVQTLQTQYPEPFQSSLASLSEESRARLISLISSR
mmetsp:Transcript_5977/g.11754  ORF Transcript_5977/g.11754 Transcript_5977/m.11754 type:complete len:1102 (-) Transcript_5977:756-4061(-)|eukprot:CAMPEP_0184683072 /NCGR_PEP_ID=MMETSP0312-20130426/9831_1 /TAXON_ID=31354 /ORGANISM="Compsopogon coeruleus, Strain SAG 36.94" /LENGTH=1101 /DNA_ID=CAMNT_0027135135 /DNA_START=199 /DNA_END=3504 /DNA_ORIENTATION=-